MSPRVPTEPTPEEQRLLAAWRTFFEANCKADFAALASIDDSVWGFEIQWEQLEKHEGLGLAFMSDMSTCLASGTIVLEEQFSLHNLSPRPVIRVLGFSELNRYHIADLRMRDRTRFLRFDAVVHSTSRAMGWLKRAAYACRECKHEWVEHEQLARARKKLETCPMCLKTPSRSSTQAESVKTCQTLEISAWTLSETTTKMSNTWNSLIQRAFKAMTCPKMCRPSWPFFLRNTSTNSNQVNA